MTVPSEVKFSYGASGISATLNNGTITAGSLTIYLNVPSVSAGEAGLAYDSGNIIGLATPSGTLVFPQIVRGGVPMILPSSGTMGNNGALSALTALPTIYADCFMYFPQGTINTVVSGPGYAAGLYYVKMSSTTAGTVYNATYSSGVPTIPANLLAFATTGLGAYTQTTAADETLISLTVPGGSIGPNGGLTVYPMWSHPNNANNKTEKIWLDGTARYSQTNTTTLSEQRPWRLSNRGSQQSQVHSTFIGLVNSASTLLFTAIDTSIDKTMLFTASLATATDYVVLESFEIQTSFR